MLTLDETRPKLDPATFTITFERSLSAPREQVFDAWTKPEHVTQWWDPTGTPLLECTIETGRTHQIRRHLTAIGHPVVGDDVYGALFPGQRMRRQALHAAELAFDHPIEGEKLVFRAPWPEDFAALVERFRAGGAP